MRIINSFPLPLPPPPLFAAADDAKLRWWVRRKERTERKKRDETDALAKCGAARGGKRRWENGEETGHEIGLVKVD